MKEVYRIGKPDYEKEFLFETREEALEVVKHHFYRGELLPTNLIIDRILVEES